MHAIIVAFYVNIHAPSGNGSAQSQSSDAQILFRKRAGSGRKLLDKLRRPHRHTTTLTKSCISWVVRRDKLNEAIYKHKKDKLFKCPKELTLESGGKHSPKLTAFLQPYGFEEDVGNKVTFTVEVNASVKSNLSSQARIHVTVKVVEPERGEVLVKPVVLENSANCRILRYKGLLTHALLKRLECDNIEIQVSASLTQ